MLNLRTVLCPTDFSSVSERGLFLATQLCEYLGARLVLQHNLDPLPPLYLASLEIVPDSELHLQEEQEERARKMLEELLVHVPDSIRSEGKITRGNAPASILRLANELSVDLIVMGTHGRGGVGHMLIGSTTERVMILSPCPVLTLRDSKHTKFLPELTEKSGTMPVVVPIDFSRGSLSNLDYACRLAGTIPIALNVLHVVEPISWDDMRGATHFNIPEYQRLRIHESSERLRSLIPSEFASHTKIHVRMGPVVEEINRCAEMIQARLIVMGTRCRSLLDELIFGAITYGVLRSSPCPVWMVPCSPSADKNAEQKPSEAEKAAPNRK